MKFFAKMDSLGRLRIPKKILDVMLYKTGTMFEVEIKPRTDKAAKMEETE